MHSIYNECEKEWGRGRQGRGEVTLIFFFVFIFINFYVIYLIESKKETKQITKSLRTIRYQVQLCKILCCLLELGYVIYYGLNLGPPKKPSSYGNEKPILTCGLS